MRNANHDTMRALSKLNQLYYFDAGLIKIENYLTSPLNMSNEKLFQQLSHRLDDWRLLSFWQTNSRSPKAILLSLIYYYLLSLLQITAQPVRKKMRSSLITLLLAPVAVLSLTTIVGENTTGPQCCDKGTADPSKHCSSLGLNAYCVGFLFQVRPRGKKQREREY